MWRSIFYKLSKFSTDLVMKTLSSLLGGFVFIYEKFTPHNKTFWSELKDHFVPHRGNDNNPHVLKHRVLAGYSVILILLKVAGIVLPVALPSSSLYSSAITIKNVVDLTNQTRTNLGLGELKINNKLVAAAQAKADDMLTNQYFSHVSPDGVTPWFWFDKVGYDYLYAGENLAVHYQEAENLQEGWLASPTHRANIVNSHYSDIGIGVSMGNFEGAESTIVVQMFAQPIPTLAAVTKQATTKPTEPVKRITVPTIMPQVTAPKENVKSVIQPAKVVTPVVKPIVVKPVVVPKAEDSIVITKVPEPIDKPETQPVEVMPVQLPIEIPASVAGSVAIGQVDTSVSDKNSAIPAPVIYDTSLIIKQAKPDSYLVKLAITGATSVAAKLVGEWVMLQPVSLGSMWEGLVPFNNNEFSQAGEQLSVVVWGKDGVVVNKPIAWVAPNTSVQKFYTFNEGTDKFAKLFGFITIHNLQDSVRQFYFYFMIFLASALLLNIFIKIRIQHFSIISHALLVLALTLFLTIV